MIEVFWKKSFRELGEFFWQMSPDEAEAFFEEYLGQKDERIQLLRSIFSESEQQPAEDLDFSAKSLIPLWRWASPRLCRRSYTRSELAVIERVPAEWARQEQLASPPLSEETIILLNDIAYYFAEVFIRNNSGVKWTICKTSVPRFIDENQPVLAGFKVPMNPRELVAVAAQKTLAHSAGDDALFRVYCKWVENLN